MNALEIYARNFVIFLLFCFVLLSFSFSIYLFFGLKKLSSPYSSFSILAYSVRQKKKKIRNVLVGDQCTINITFQFCTTLW